jgi:hypothetical protein
MTEMYVGKRRHFMMRCNKAWHQISFIIGGRISLHNHPNWTAEEVVSVFSKGEKELPACIQMIYDFRNMEIAEGGFTKAAEDEIFFLYEYRAWKQEQRRKKLSERKARMNIPDMPGFEQTAGGIYFKEGA